MTRSEQRRARRTITVLLVLVLIGIAALVTAVLWTSRDAGRQANRADTAESQADAAELDRATACAQVQRLGLRCAVPLPPQEATDPSKASPPLAGRDGAEGPVGPIGITGARGPIGPPGKTGQPGMSAYQLAVKAGFRGTVSQWLTSLKGQDGQDGTDGQNGQDGVAGTDGSPGQPGTDGSAGTPGADGQTCVDRDHDDLWSCTPGPYTGPTESAAEDTPGLLTLAPPTAAP